MDDTERRRSSTPTKARSLWAAPSSACSSSIASRSAWTVVAAGATTYSSSGCGNPSSMKKSIYTPTRTSRRPDQASVGTSSSITRDDSTRRVTARHPITSTSNRSAPWLGTSDEISDPQAFRMWLEVDGRRSQDGSTRTIVLNVRCLMSYISQFMSLQPGDIISTGTPPSIGLGQKPPVYLHAGQQMR